MTELGAILIKYVTLPIVVLAVSVYGAWVASEMEPGIKQFTLMFVNFCWFWGWVIAALVLLIMYLGGCR